MNIKACSMGVNMKMDMARHGMHMHMCISKKRRAGRGGVLHAGGYEIILTWRPFRRRHASSAARAYR